jgi:DNA-binding CsgD family transcriptional regulator
VPSEATELVGIIADIYDAAIDPSLWQKALARICAYVGGSEAALIWHDAVTQRSLPLHLFNDRSDYTRLYFDKYLSMNPLLPASSFIEEGKVHSIDDVMPYREFAESRFYKEWASPQGLVDAIAVNLEKDATRTSLIDIRMRVFHDDGMRRRLSLLAPHLQRAVAIERLFHHTKGTRDVLTDSLDHVEASVFLVRADGTIAFSNDPARKMIAEALLVRERDKVLHAVAPETDLLLHDIFASADRGNLSVGRRGVAVPLANAAHERWFAHVVPLTSGRRQHAGQDHVAVAAVFIRRAVLDTPPPLESIAKLYGLTASQVRVLDATLKVTGVKAVADLLGLSEATVKSHLNRLFKKTGTQRQSDLVKLVAGI